MDIRDAIKPTIDKSGLKQFVVAERTGLSQQQLCDISNKRRRFDANEMIAFCKAVGVTPDELCATAERIGEPLPNSPTH